MTASLTENTIRYNRIEYKALSTINTAKATGADNIPTKAIKIAAGYIPPSVTYLFNESFRLGSFPSAWKIAWVSPLFKGADTTNCENQRPISVLSCLSKIHERIACQYTT